MVRNVVVLTMIGVRESNLEVPSEVIQSVINLWMLEIYSYNKPET